eukprot:IDg15915t1
MFGFKNDCVKYLLLATREELSEVQVRWFIRVLQNRYRAGLWEKVSRATINECDYKTPTIKRGAGEDDRELRETHARQI